MPKDSTVSPSIKPNADIKGNVPCPVCFAHEKGIALSSIIEGAAEQWEALHKHKIEQHDKEVSQQNAS